MAAGHRTGRSAGSRLTLVMGLVLVTGACGSSAATPVDTAAPVDPVPTTAETIGPSPTPAAVAATPVQTESPTASVVEPDAGVLPRSIQYGVLTWTVDDAVITNQDPKRYVFGEAGTPTADTWLILDLGLRNDNVAVGIVADQARLLVTLPDGTEVVGKNQQQVGVPPASTASGRYAFEVPADTTFDGLTLSIADPGVEPSLDQPFSGPATDPESNSTKRLDDSAKIPLPGIAMTWKLQDQIVGRDWPLPLGSRGGAHARDGTSRSRAATARHHGPGEGRQVRLPRRRPRPGRQRSDLHRRHALQPGLALELE